MSSERRPDAVLSLSKEPVEGVQRLRLTFAKGEELKYIAHLDLMRLWERALRRAGVPMAHSEGYNPHPSLSLAAPLPVGVTSEGELLDILLYQRVSLRAFLQRVRRQLPQGIELLEVQEVELKLPSLPSQVRFAEYRVTVKADRPLEEIEEGLRSLLTKESLPWQHLRDGQVRRYDLRALVDDLQLLEHNDGTLVLGMRLRSDSTGSGRAEQVTAALGFAQPPQAIHRTRLLLATAL